MFFFYFHTVLSETNEREVQLSSREVDKIEELYYLISEHLNDVEFRFFPDIVVQLVSNSLAYCRGMESDKIKIAISNMAAIDHSFLPREVIREWARKKYS